MSQPKREVVSVKVIAEFKNVLVRMPAENEKIRKGFAGEFVPEDPLGEKKGFLHWQNQMTLPNGIELPAHPRFGMIMGWNDGNQKPWFFNLHYYNLEEADFSPKAKIKKDDSGKPIYDNRGRIVKSRPSNLVVGTVRIMEKTLRDMYKKEFVFRNLDFEKTEGRPEYKLHFVESWRPDEKSRFQVNLDLCVEFIPIQYFERKCSKCGESSEATTPWPEETKGAFICTNCRMESGIADAVTKLLATPLSD